MSMKMKGIIPTIAIIVLLMMTVSMAGFAWLYINGYMSGMISKTIEITGATCSGNTATVIVKNVGRSPINIDACSGKGNSYQCGELGVVVQQADDSGIPLWRSQTLPPGGVAQLDSTCTGDCRYRILQSFSSMTVGVQCSPVRPMTITRPEPDSSRGASPGSGPNYFALRFSEEVELDTIILRSSPLVIRCTKGGYSPMTYSCWDVSIFIRCTTYDNKDFVCEADKDFMFRHSELQVIGMAGSRPIGGKLRLGGPTAASSLPPGAAKAAPMVDLSPPEASAYFEEVTQESGTLVVNAWDPDSFVDRIYLSFSSPSRPDPVPWPAMPYVSCQMENNCIARFHVTGIDGPGGYEFTASAINKDGYAGSASASVAFEPEGLDTSPPSIETMVDGSGESVTLIVNVTDIDSQVTWVQLYYTGPGLAKYFPWEAQPYRSCGLNSCKLKYFIKDILGPGTYSFMVNASNRDSFVGTKIQTITLS